MGEAKPPVPDDRLESVPGMPVVSNVWTWVAALAGLLLRTVVGRLNLTLLGIAFLAATFLFTDRITNRQPTAPRIDRAEVVARRQPLPAARRVFCYVIDSLRFETAVDPAIMPNLVRLRAEGAWARVESGFNSGSAAALRDAFTGRENAAVVAAVATLIRSDGGGESLFHQMSAAGITSATYSAGFFRQFGEAVTREVDLGLATTPSLEQQEEHVLAAVAAFASGEFDFVLGHLAHGTDHAAHDLGVGTPAYAAVFRRADALIPVIRSRLPPGVTFLVTGDHGHDLAGRHGVGLDVPTVTVYLGPRFRRGVDLGSVPIMSHRYLLSQALQLPLQTQGYVGRYLPDALEPGTGPPPPRAENAPVDRGDAKAWIWFYLSAFGMLWFNLVCRAWSPFDFSHGREVALWLAVVPLFVRGSWQVPLAAAVLAGLLFLHARLASAGQFVRWGVLPVVALLGLREWGRVLLAARPWLDALPPRALAVYWVVALMAGVALATRARRTRVMAVIFGVPALLFPQTHYHYGFPGTLAPLMVCWFAFFLASLLRDGAWRARGVAARDALRLSVVAAILLVLLQPLASPWAVAGSFERWQALLPGLSADDLVYFGACAFIGLLVAFFPSRPRWTELLPGVALIGLLLPMASRVWVPDFDLWSKIALSTFAGWAGFAWWRRSAARVFGLAFLFLLYFDFVALTPRNFLETAVMIGALALCAQFVAWFPQRENTAADAIVLAAFGVMIAGWASMRWSVTHIEWHAIYEWTTREAFEANVVWFVPWIALKGLVPWGIMIWCLRDRLHAFGPFPAAPLFAIFAAKTLAMTMVNTGLGTADTFNRSYLEAACALGVMTILFLGLIVLPGAWPPADAAQRRTDAEPAD